MKKILEQSIGNFISLILVLITLSCNTNQPKTTETPPEKEETKVEKPAEITAKTILGNPKYPAISYGGYRQNTRDIQPTLAELKEDMKILNAMGIRILRTYNNELPHAANVLKAISELKKEDSNFEMYVMLGAWINCKGAWTGSPNHQEEDTENNAAEIKRTVDLAKQHPDIVKIIAVGNEAMVHWAGTYFVKPSVILKYVNQLQELKTAGELSKDLWITSSDNFASWGGQGPEYHTEDLNKLIQAVDYVSMHTYPMHDSHYNPHFWKVLESEGELSKAEKIAAAMQRALKYAQSQYESTSKYVHKIAPDKPIHIGETGWATSDNVHYGTKGSKATDEYKSGIYHKLMRDWTKEAGIACFYFEAFDEPWKDAQNIGGSENYFGIFDVNGKAKYAVWDLVDEGVFEGLTRGGNAIVKTYEGDEGKLLEEVVLPSMK